MKLDIGRLLHELELGLREGSRPDTWLLHTADGTLLEVRPVLGPAHLDARTVRSTLALRTPTRPLLVGRSATPAVLRRALAGEFDILTAAPARLIHHGRSYGHRTPEHPSPPATRRTHRAWIRWGVERHLLLSSEPTTQRAIAEALGTSQQAVSLAVHRLGRLVSSERTGVQVHDRSALLTTWLDDYSGPGGVEIGWYSLEPVVEQVRTAVGVARMLEVASLVGGDVAADVIAPWKLPVRGRVYVDGPVDLEGDGFVPAPLTEATLVTCIPQDPTLWRLVDLHPAATDRRGGLPIADPLIVMWDLLDAADVDNPAAAEKIAEMLRGPAR